MILTPVQVYALIYFQFYQILRGQQFISVSAEACPISMTTSGNTEQRPEVFSIHKVLFYQTKPNCASPIYHGDAVFSLCALCCSYKMNKAASYRNLQCFFSKKNIAVFTPQQRKRENRKRRPRILIYSQSMKKFAAIYFLRAASVLPLIVQNSFGAVRYCWAEQAQALKMIYRYRLSVRRDKWRVELTRNTI